MEGTPRASNHHLNTQPNKFARLALLEVSQQHMAGTDLSGADRSEVLARDLGVRATKLNHGSHLSHNQSPVLKWVARRPQLFVTGTAPY